MKHKGRTVFITELSDTMPSHKYLRDRIGKTDDRTEQETPKKRKRRKVLPQERKRRAIKYRNSQKKNEYRSAIRDSRIYLGISKYEFICDAIDASNNLLLSLNQEASNKSLVIDIERELRLMKGRAIRYQRELEESKSTLTTKRCKRKRKKKNKITTRYINDLIQRRRHHRILTKSVVDYSQSSRIGSGYVEKKRESRESLFDSDESDSSHSSFSDQSDDSEIGDETYVPEVYSNKRRKRRKAWGKRGNNESNVVDQEDIFAEDYESLNDKYQFAIDLKKKDFQPGKEIQFDLMSNVISNRIPILQCSSI
jgi:hypothetical protein